MKPSKKRILLICQVMPAESGSGVSMRLYNWAQSLSLEGDLTILLISQGITDTSNSINGIEAKVICHDNQKAVAAYERRHNCFLPEMFKKWDTAKLTSSLKEFQSHSFDVVVVSRLRLAPTWSILKNRLHVSSKKSIIDFDDIESIALWRQLRNNYKTQKLRQIAWTARECLKLYIAEINSSRLFDFVVTCSRTDAKKLKNWWFIKYSTHVPNCVQDTTPQKIPKNTSKPNILFVGTLNYAPNEQGIKWFIEEAWSPIKEILKQKNIEPTLTVVGKNPTSWMREMGHDDSISVHGNVESVIPFYSRATLIICPIFQGGGTRIKILEAFSHSRAVVSTTLGAEGIEAIDNEHILIANTATEFIATITDLVQNTRKTKLVEEKAFELFNEKYSSRSFMKHVSDLIKQ
jgi:glycosyltransferase involved in cell wall biosynthesis